MFCVTASSSKYGSLSPLETDTELVMLHAENQDRLYLITATDEQQALVGSLAFNVRIVTGWCIAPWADTSMPTCRKPTC